MKQLRRWIPRLMGAGLLVGAAGCTESVNSNGDGPGFAGENPGNVGDLKGSVDSALLRAESCPDLLSKIQADAVIKLQLAAVRAKHEIALNPEGGPNAGIRGEATGGGDSFGSSTGGTGGPGLPPSTGSDVPQNTGAGSEGGGDGDVATGDPGSTHGPTSASDTNTQVDGVDEADFVKLAKGGERMFLLHGSTLLALKSWPAAQTALEGKGLQIEGSPSEMFVTEDGTRAVVFSTVNDYGGAISGGAALRGDYCGPGYCGGGQSFAKVTLADVSGDVPKTLRELYYEGSYLSSRRYPGENQDVVRAIFQAYSRYQGLFYPDIETRDPWGRVYAGDVIDRQLAEWVERTSASIRATVLSDWLPLVREAKAGKLSTVEPACDAYYVPKAGLADYGLTHVLSMDITQAAGPLGGITIMGAAQTVYSNADHLVLAQPDYRWGPAVDFGLVDQQQTALHMFAIDGAKTSYAASGWVPGFVPGTNSQFAIDEKGGALRIATTGWVRDNPKAEQDTSEFWQQHPENRVFALQAHDSVLSVSGKTEPLGHERETITAARFVGDRGYVVTFERTDPLIVVDVADPTKLVTLGEIEIPGFSEYMHPIDDDHLVTIGQNGTDGGTQLQMFDVSDPKQIPQPMVLDFGQGSSSEARYNHKAFTYFAEKNVLAVPLYNYGYDARRGNIYGSSLQLIKVSTQTGFKLLGGVNHAPLYATSAQNCGRCDQQGCYDYSCGYAPEVRRGHFVADDADTFVYSISYGGVLVNNLDDLVVPVAKVELPAPQWSDGSWYGLGDGSGMGTYPGGGSEGGSTGSASGGDPVSVTPEPAADAGSSVPGDADGGVAME